jgi:hypothetical protein
MISTIAGDHSAFPESIRTVFPHLVGETCELRQSWSVYAYLFMEDQSRTEALASRFGGMLGMFQNLLQDEIFLSIARLTDKDSRMQTNLSLWTLLPACIHAKQQCFSEQARGAIERVFNTAEDIRKHRHKRIAHFDLSVNLRISPLPVVVFKEIPSLLSIIEEYLNLFYWEFGQTTMLFDTLSPHEIVALAEITAFKAKAYDELEGEGLIPKSEWRRRLKK